MDKYILDQNFDKFKANKIHLDSYSIKKIGIIGNQTILKINDFHLNCFPYDLSLRSCNVLMILDKKEIVFFTQSFDKVHSVHFVFQNAMYKKPISLFLRCKIINLKVMNPETNHCLVSLQYTAIPNDYKEILINSFKREEALKYLFNNEQFRSRTVERNFLPEANIDDSIHLRTEQGSEPVKMIVTNTSMVILRIIGDDSQNHYLLNSRVQVELFNKDNSFFIDGTIAIRTESQEIPGYSIMDVKLEFSSYLTDLLYQHFKRQSAQKDTPPESE